MSTDATTLYGPLYAPETDASYALPLDMAIDVAREQLAESATANIHDHQALLRAAVHLEMRLRQLVAALDTEAGR
ncbi:MULTISPECIES: hypothetical protein [unclassified Streptomyces]|uniref:hypothetical protein n=1 Tax=unclassified Streptomyces TaxID=2593676 RepID=UPI000805833C|nr:MULTISPECIES: hypothetical protein [unclassified Streptomyces]MYR76556.1 hypothetical protein [Streptomyces sp. SID4925]SBV00069.1 hypothetical protein YUMDRAFT_06325 [Streptomyces sp. OspMP-M45]